MTLRPTSVLAILGSLALAALFLAGVKRHASTEAEIAADPLVTSLRPLAFKTRIGYGDDPAFVAPDFPDAAWTEAPFPLPVAADVRHQPGATGPFAYYRLRVPVSDAQLASGKEIAFSPLYVSHPLFEVFVDGRLAFRSEARAQLFPNVVVTIPPAAVRDGIASVVIKGTMAPGYIGIAHRGGIYVGPRESLDRLYVHVERAMGSYFQLFLVAKGGIFVVFALFYLFNPASRGLGAFLVYALFSTLEHLFSGDFLHATLGFPLALAGLFGAKTLGALALGNFWYEFFANKRSPLANWLVASAIALVVAVVAYQYGLGGLRAPAVQLFPLTDALLVAIALAAAAYGAVVTRRLAIALPRNEERYAASRNMLVVVGVYLALLLWEYLFHVFVGFDKRPVFDLLLFYYLALVNARTFARQGVELARQREELAKAQVHAAMARTAQMLAHDVRKPFSLLRAAVAGLQSERNPEIESIMRRVGPELERAIASVDGMVGDLMAIDAPARASREVVPAAALLDEVLAVAERLHAGRSLEIIRDIKLTRPLLVDRPRVTRMLGNVVDNAFQAARGERPKLWVTAHEVSHGKGSAALLVIGNSGSFVAPDDREQLFDSFFTKGKKGGTGLGLAIARRVAREHGGEIWCESDPERGTEFKMRLPLAPLEGALPEILFIEDSPFLRETWAKAADMIVHTFATPQELTAAIEADASLLTRCHCVVTDYYFGDAGSELTGSDVARVVRQRAPELPILVATDGPTREMLESGGFDGAIGKDLPAWSELMRRGHTRQ